MNKLFVILSFVFAFVACSSNASQATEQESINDSAAVVMEPQSFPTKVIEIPTPDGYSRATVDSTSFAFYLRHLSLKPEGTRVYSYEGIEQWTSDHA